MRGYWGRGRLMISRGRWVIRLRFMVGWGWTIWSRSRGVSTIWIHIG